MKKIYMIFIILLIISGCSSKYTEASTKINSQINTDLKIEVDNIKIDFIKSVLNSDYKKLETIFSSELMESQNFNLKNFVDQFKDIFLEYNFYLKDQYYTTVNKVGKNTTLTITPPIPGDQLVINNLRLYSKETYNSFYISNNLGREYLLFLNLSKIKDKWQINTVQIGKYGFNGFNAPDLYQESVNLNKYGNQISGLIYSLAMDEFLNPAPYLQYKSDELYRGHSTESITNIMDLMKFPHSLGSVEILGLDYVITEDMGLVPIVLYLTNKELKLEELQKEFETFKIKFQDYTKNISADFSAVALRAFNERPISNTTEYKSYTYFLE